MLFYCGRENNHLLKKFYNNTWGVVIDNGMEVRHKHHHEEEYDDDNHEYKCLPEENTLPHMDRMLNQSKLIRLVFFFKKKNK
jgi:hypothetical protein